MLSPFSFFFFKKIHEIHDHPIDTETLFKNRFIYLFLAVLGLRFCAWAFSSCSEQGLPFVEVHGLLIAVASLFAEHGL